MTRNKRAKRAARTYQQENNVSYAKARRLTVNDQGRADLRSVRQFTKDHCANCLEPLPQRIDSLYCSDLCKDIAEAVRYWRRITRDGRDKKSDVKLAVQTQTGHLLAGGYHERARRLTPTQRRHIGERDHGRCVQCGDPGKEIDHIDGDSNDMVNLQLLCSPCHQKKTAQRMWLADEEQTAWVDNLRHTRVVPDTPILLCDDQDEWQVVHWGLKRQRRQRLLAELAERGHKRRDFPHITWAAMWDFVIDGTPLPRAPQDGDDENWEEMLADAYDDFGDEDPEVPYSYFADTMASSQ